MKNKKCDSDMDLEQGIMQVSFSFGHFGVFSHLFYLLVLLHTLHTSGFKPGSLVLCPFLTFSVVSFNFFIPGLPLNSGNRAQLSADAGQRRPSQKEKYVSL